MIIPNLLRQVGSLVVELHRRHFEGLLSLQEFITVIAVIVVALLTVLLGEMLN
jgi:hypothetical protein